MAVDYSLLRFAKGPLRVEVKREKRLSADEKERLCREQVWRLYGRKCAIPGCREKAVHQHHLVYRSRSVKLKYEPTNRAPICAAHHYLIHAGKIELLPRDRDGVLVVKGERKYLAFKL